MFLNIQLIKKGSNQVEPFRVYLERETRFELATSTLARLHSTTELFPLFVFVKTGPYLHNHKEGVNKKTVCSEDLQIFYRQQA